MSGPMELGGGLLLFEPFYENYGADAFITGASPRYVTLREPDWSFDESELSAAFSNRTRAIVLNTPSNPTGKVFSREELTTIARLCEKHGARAITDEIYEHTVSNAARHTPLPTIPHT